MNTSAAVPKLLLVAAPVTAIFLYWMWRRRQNGSLPPSSAQGHHSRANPSAAGSSGKQRITVTLEVPEFAVGFVIGRGGENIRKIESETGARVKLRDDPDDRSKSRTEIFGFPDQVARAEMQVRQAITDKVHSVEESKKKNCTVEIVLPRHTIGRVIGRRGETIRNIERVSRARVRVERSTRLADEERLCIITGSDDHVAAAADMVRDEIAQEAIDHKARARGTPDRSRAAAELPTSDHSSHAAPCVDVDWSKLAASLAVPVGGGSVDVFVSAACNPRCFWAQAISHTARELEQLTEAMTSLYSGLSRNECLVERARVGDVCAAMYRDDDKWYRARIMDMRTDRLDVFFLDYGDSQYMERTDLRAMKPEFLQLPFQAVLCCLSDVSPVSGKEWSTEACNLFQTMTFAGDWKPLVMQIKTLPSRSDPAELRPEPYDVQLIDTSSSDCQDLHIGKCLVDAGMAVSSGSAANSCNGGTAQPSENGGAVCSLDGTSSQGESSAVCANSSSGLSSSRPQEDCFSASQSSAHKSLAVVPPAELAKLPETAFGSLIQVRVTAVRDPSYFWVQLGSELDSIEKMNDDMTEYYSQLNAGSLQLTDLRAGVVCCAMFGHDETFHRAMVTSIVDREYVSVQYLDYGDTGNVRLDNVKELREEYLKMPFQAIPCQMANIVSAEGTTWSRESVDKFEQLTHAGSWQCNLLNLVLPASPESLPKVELFCMVAEGVSVSDKMVEDGFAQWRKPTSTWSSSSQRMSRSSLSSEPAVLVEKALTLAEEEDIEKSVRKLPVLGGTSSTGQFARRRSLIKDGTSGAGSSPSGIKLAASFSANKV